MGFPFEKVFLPVTRDWLAAEWEITHALMSYIRFQWLTPFRSPARGSPGLERPPSQENCQVEDHPVLRGATNKFVYVACAATTHPLS